jgi:hypothetical protein
MNMHIHLVKTAIVLGAFGMLLAGCASVSPDHIISDRQEYGQVIADSWKRQTLLNVVRLRYADAPVFLDVSSIINSYNISGKANASAEVPSFGDPNVLRFGGEGSWSNTPTVTYQPLMGDRFTRSLLQPIPPMAVFQLMQGGWPAELVFPAVVSSINGLRNSWGGTAEDPRFRQLVEALARIQRAGDLGFRVDSRKDGGAVLIVLRRQGKGARPSEDGLLVRNLLGMEEGLDEIQVAYGLAPRNIQEVAMLSRSMLELIMQLGVGIELPAAHAADGRALPLLQADAGTRAAALVKIHSGSSIPADAYVATPYKGYWYWIDDTDIASKRMFTFLMILFSLAETGQNVAAPIVTVPSR